MRVSAMEMKWVLIEVFCGTIEWNSLALCLIWHTVVCKWNCYCKAVDYHLAFLYFEMCILVIPRNSDASPLWMEMEDCISFALTKLRGNFHVLFLSCNSFIVHCLLITDTVKFGNISVTGTTNYIFCVQYQVLISVLLNQEAQTW